MDVIAVQYYIVSTEIVSRFALHDIKVYYTRYYGPDLQFMRGHGKYGSEPEFQNLLVQS